MKAIDFVTLTTNVPNGFVNDLYQFYNEDTLQTDFVIDLEILSKWLSTPRKELIRTLQRSYVIDIDYIKHKTRNPVHKKYGSNYYMKYMVTPDCFKRMCMLTKSANGDMIRRYFIEIENAYIKYRHQTLKGIEEEMKIMQNNKTLLKDKVNGSGYIYILKASKDKDSVYKIGRTLNIHSRIRQYNTGKAEDIEVVYVYQTDYVKEVENCLKSWLKSKQYKKYKEIYQVDVEVIKQIITTCDGIGKGLKIYRKRGKPKMDGGWYVHIQSLHMSN